MIIAATFMFAGSVTTANATVASSTTTTIKKVKAEGDIYTVSDGGVTYYFVENADGLLDLICACTD